MSELSHQAVWERSEVSTRLREDPADLILIDLDRVPSFGLYMGTFLRQRKATRHLPLVYVGGATDKVARVRAHLPDAVFASWEDLGPALERALDAPPVAPIVPRSEELHAGRSLHQKLGLKPGARIALLGLPTDFDLGPLPEGASLRTRAQGKLDVAFLFAAEERGLAKGLDRAEVLLDAGAAVWIVWDKDAGGLKLPSIRAAAKERALVDFKVCRLPGGLSCTRISRRRR